MVLAFCFNGSTEITVRIVEILIAVAGLYAFPKSMEIKLEGLFNKNLTLAEKNVNVNIKEDVVFKLNAMSTVFEELSDSFMQNTFLNEDIDKTKKKLIEMFNSISATRCSECAKNGACWEENEDKVYKEIFRVLEDILNGEDIKVEDIDLECEDKGKLLEMINQMITEYKLEEIYNKKEKQNQRNMSDQFKNVSKVISDMAVGIDNEDEEDIEKKNKVKEELYLNGFNIYDMKIKKDNDNITQISLLTDIFSDIDREKREIENVVGKVLGKRLVTKLIINSSKLERSRIKLVVKPNIDFKIGICSQTKDKSSLSGDNYCILDLEDGKHMIALSDGMGTGTIAEYNSRTTIGLLKKLLGAGFEKDNALNLINSVMFLKNNSESFSTIDLTVIDTQNELVELLKIGSSLTYIKKGQDDIRTIQSDNLPIGTTIEFDFKVHSKKIESGDYIIMVTDGVNDIEECGVLKTDWLTDFLKNDKTQNPQLLAENIIERAKEMSDNIVKDDMTVIVIQII